MKTILEKYVGKQIGINCRSPDTFVSATLSRLTDSIITVTLGQDIYHFPIHGIKHIVEPEGGVKLDGPLLNRKKAPVAVTVDHLIIYKGAIGMLGVLFSIPN